MNGYEEFIIFCLDWHRGSYVPGAAILGENSNGQAEVLRTDNSLTNIGFAWKKRYI